MNKADYDELVRLRGLGCRLAFYIRNEYRYAATEMPKYCESPELELPGKIHEVTSGTLQFVGDGEFITIAAAIAEYERAQEVEE